MRYAIEFSGFVAGTIEIEARDEDEARDIFYDMPDSEILEAANADVANSVKIDDLYADEPLAEAEYVFD